jgi:hypothetical protein
MSKTFLITGLIVDGVIFLFMIFTIIISMTPLCEKIFKSSVTKANINKSKNYKNVSSIHYKEPLNRFPLFLDFLWILLGTMLIYFGIQALYGTIVGHLVNKTAIWRWILWAILYVLFPIKMAVDGIIDLTTWGKKYKARRDKRTRSLSVTLKQEISITYNKCLDILNGMKTQIFEMDKNNASPIKAWKWNPILGDTVINVTLSQINNKEVKIVIVSNNQWINLLGVVFNINQRNVDIFRNLILQEQFNG